jgi:hypothetical protein
VRLPDLAPVVRLQRALADAGAPSVVGGSALLASLGLVDVVHDWDVLTDGEELAVAEALAGLGMQATREPGESLPAVPGSFASRALYRISDGPTEIDLIVGFAIRTSGGTVAIPAIPGRTWRGLTLARPEEWVLAYAAMGRPEKAALLLQVRADATVPVDC